MPRLQRLLLSLLFIVTVPAVLATLLSLLTAQVWWLKLLDFPRFQLLLLHLGLLLGLAGLLGLGRRQRQPVRRWVLVLNLLGALVQLQGGRVKQLPVRHFPRFAGTAKYNLWNRAWKPLVDTFGFRWIRSRWKNYEIGEQHLSAPAASVSNHH